MSWIFRSASLKKRIFTKKEANFSKARKTRKTKALRIIKRMKTQNRLGRKLLLKIKELRQKTQLFSSLAGVAGFEPTNDDTKNRCLTTWRHPKEILFHVQMCIWNGWSIFMPYFSFWQEFFYHVKNADISCRHIAEKRQASSYQGVKTAATWRFDHDQRRASLLSNILALTLLINHVFLSRNVNSPPRPGN